MNAPEFVIDTLYKTIKDEWKQSIFMSLHQKFISILNEENNTECLQSIFYVNSKSKLCPELVLEAVILLQYHSVTFNIAAKKFVSERACVNVLPESNYEIIDMIVNLCDDEVLEKTKKDAAFFLSQTKNSQAFNGVLAFIISAATVKPIEAGLFRSKTADLRKEIVKGFSKVGDFDKFFTSLFTVISNIMSARAINNCIIEELVGFGFKYVSLGLNSFNLSFVKFLVSGFRKGTIKLSIEESIDNIASLFIFGENISYPIAHTFQLDRFDTRMF